MYVHIFVFFLNYLKVTCTHKTLHPYYFIMQYLRKWKFYLIPMPLLHLRKLIIISYYLISTSYPNSPNCFWMPFRDVYLNVLNFTYWISWLSVSNPEQLLTHSFYDIDFLKSSGQLFRLVYSLSWLFLMMLLSISYSRCILRITWK